MRIRRSGGKQGTATHIGGSRRSMKFQVLDALRREHPAWRLLTADHAPIIIAFLHECFVEPNVHTLARESLKTHFDDFRDRQRDLLGPEALPRPSLEYLDEWARDDRGWLRKYYPEGSDEAHFDITPATQRAIDWVAGLTPRHFVGTESRLLTVFELLRQIVEGAQSDPARRVADLDRRRAALDVEIERARAGDVEVLEPTQIRDRFLQLDAVARGLLSDFREVEQNFRDLDRSVREQVATWEAGKGALLEQIFGRSDAIRDSDQGRSFHAFWDFLMAPSRQEELTSLLEAVLDLGPVKELAPDRRLGRIHYDWLEAGEIAQRMVARLSQQLRRYLDDRVWLENRRIMQIQRMIEHHALALRAAPPDGPVTEIDALVPSIAVPLDRPMFNPGKKIKLAGDPPIEGAEDADPSALFEQTYIDREQIASRVRRALQTRDQISLAELAASYPLEHGLAELVAYFGLAADDADAVIDDEESDCIDWVDEQGRRRVATFPRVLFTRAGSRRTA